jgi:hypothetical protein
MEKMNIKVKSARTLTDEAWWGCLYTGLVEEKPKERKREKPKL